MVGSWGSGGSGASLEAGAGNLQLRMCGVEAVPKFEVEECESRGKSI